MGIDLALMNLILWRTESLVRPSSLLIAVGPNPFASRAMT
jgi:hypothetical protein